ncbi:DNA alkylation repair protein [Roseobacter ponti]|uniref:DNA alkylation repair enzyme n=1 Tax=Roseobacter ponti TaxID=1891787 RepID=A0A858SSI3_9RHOB|nr:DNA alkylation repair protein [Roseobacter ponti]QJF50878.1 hypothetical protein G3256_06750 [Roseobacter ponti]
MSAKTLLKDQLFNAETVGQLAREFAAALPFFDAGRFQRAALAGFAERELMARLEWIADCAEAQLSADFEEMADQLEAAMPPRLDPTLRDNDFGHFIHAVPGILAARHGLEAHRAMAMKLIYAATQRFSMEFYIRAFLTRWPEETLADLAVWAEDDNYHVRRLVSEGTRPRLPWARAVSLSPEQTLPLLDRLSADPARFVTRSVANHLNDLSKGDADLVVARLAIWADAAEQDPGELAWMTRHALRTAVKSGHPGALLALGYRQEAPLAVTLSLDAPTIRIGDALAFSCEIAVTEEMPVLVDYRISFYRPSGRASQKVFKLRQGIARPGHPFTASKFHAMKGDATTFTLHPGRHAIVLQVNGVDRAEAFFDLTG